LERSMKTYRKLFLIFSLLFCGNAVAQADLAGTWQGKLAVSANEKMTIQFILTKKTDGSYGAVLNSPDSGGIKNVAATAVKYAGGKLSIEVASLSGSYTGTVAKGTITGEWKQQGSTLPLVLTPYKKPEAAALKPLLGRWEGKLAPPGSGELTIVLRFEMAKDGSFAGFLDVPEQGAKGIPIGDISLEGIQFAFKIPSVGVDYTGKLAGTGIDGTFKQGGAEFELDLSKGKYQPPPLNLPAEVANRLLGKWAGKLDIPGDVLHNIILQFEKTKDGKYFASWECPERGTVGSRIADIVLKGDQFSCRIPATGGKYTGKLVKDSISGTYEVGGKQHPLNVVKGAKYEPQVAQVDIPADVMKQLLGRWTAKLGTLTVIVRFEQNPGGSNVIFIDIPDQNVKGLQILKASLKEGTLWMKMSGSEYSGKLNGNKIDGGLKLIEQGGTTVPLPLTKG
jgi:hypothetical protein